MMITIIITMIFHIYAVSIIFVGWEQSFFMFTYMVNHRRLRSRTGPLTIWAIGANDEKINSVWHLY